MTKTTKTQCFTCKKGTRTFICEGCAKNFCRIDLIKHFEELSIELEQIENNHDEVRQNLNNQKDNPNNCLLIHEINQWEEESIQKIKQTANQCREKIIKYKHRSLINIENNLNELTNEIKTIRQENEFNEIDLNQLKQTLNKLEEELNKPSNISIKQQSTTFINRIFVSITIDKDIKWKQDGITIAGGNGEGDRLDQFDRSYGICIDGNQTIYIADCHNHRIIAWKLNAINGQIVAGGNGEGSYNNQLRSPTDVVIDKKTNSLIIADYGNGRVVRWSLENNTTNGVIIISDIACYGLAMNKNGDLYLSDCKKNEVRRWRPGERYDTVLVAGGNGKGAQLNQFHTPTYLLVDENNTLYVSDADNHRIMKWMKNATEGIIIAGGNNEGDSLAQLSCPQGLVVDYSGQIFVVDTHNDRIMRWFEGDKQGTIVIGGHGQGSQSNQLNSPVGLLFDPEGNLYVVDSDNNRIQKYEID